MTVVMPAMKVWRLVESSYYSIANSGEQNSNAHRYEGPLWVPHIHIYQSLKHVQSRRNCPQGQDVQVSRPGMDWGNNTYIIGSKKIVLEYENLVAGIRYVTLYGSHTIWRHNLIKLQVSAVPGDQAAQLLNYVLSSRELQ